MDVMIRANMQLGLNIFTLFVGSLILYFYCHEHKVDSFSKLIILIILSTIFNMFGVLAGLEVTNIAYTLNYISVLIYCLLRILYGYYLIKFIMELYKVDNKGYYNIINFIKVLVVIDIIFVVISMHYGYTIYLNDVNQFIRGEGYTLLMLSNFTFPFIAILIIFLETNFKDKIQRNESIFVGICILMRSIVNVFDTFIENEIQLVLVITIISLLVLYLKLLNNRIIDYKYISAKNKNLNKLLEKEIMLDELKASINSMQPIFISSVLNSLYKDCDTNNELSIKLCNKVSQYLEQTLKSDKDRDTISFKEELEYINMYIEIEYLRYNNIFLRSNIHNSKFNIPTFLALQLIQKVIQIKDISQYDKVNLDIEVNTFLDNHEVIFEFEFIGNEKINKLNNYDFKDISARLSDLVHGSLNVYSDSEIGTIIIMLMPK